MSAWLHEDARHHAPDDLDAVLRRTRTERQRPAWSSLERWLPVQTTLRLSPVPRVAWILVILALVIALGVAAVLVVGSRRHPLPPPFGPARNGLIVYGGSDHDIHALDLATGATTSLIAGTEGDHRPVLSPDGTKVVFFRDTKTIDMVAGGYEPMLMVANVDGTEVRALTGALENGAALLRNVAWSSDGSKVAVSSGPGASPLLQVFTVDGSAKPVGIDVHGMTPEYLTFRPGDREIVFRGFNAVETRFYAVGADGRGLRTIVPPFVGDGASLSPDGTKLAYQTWDGTLGIIHIVDVDTGVDTVPAFDPPASAGLADDKATWSPDGTRLVFVTYRGAQAQLSVAPAAGGRRVPIGPTMGTCSCQVWSDFSPDGSKVLVHYDADGSTWVLDPAGRTEGVQLPSHISDALSWQRQAFAP
ncbi:MAG TPA: hypothetical protein VID95_13020 [Candidatus Limnocylindrales bacterium]